VREVIVEVPREYVEDVLDQLLPLVRGGVRELERGARVELRMRGDGVPATAEIDGALARWPHRTAERTVPDDWRERRLADFEPDMIGGRLVVRPEWAPRSSNEGILEIVLGESAAFGAGTHPTTRACLEVLLELTPRGSFADLGCGSGLLAIAAARLGWDPVTALDVLSGSVEATRANAGANGVSVRVDTADLATEAPPGAEGFAANVPAWLHTRIAASLPEPVPVVAVVSGFVPAEAPAVVEGYARRGLALTRGFDTHGWTVGVLEHGLR